MANALQVEFLQAGLIDSNGDALAGGKVYTYEAGTTNNKACWTAADKSVAATNPVMLDANGVAIIYADGNYKFVVKTAADVTVYTWDNIYFGIPADSNKVVQSKTADYTAASTDDVILVNATSGSVTISLPASGSNEGKEYLIIKTDASANTVTVDPNGAETINGDSTIVLGGQYQALEIVSDGSNWLDKFTLLDEDDMSSDSDARGATQQSIKAYVDSGTVTMTNKTLTDPVLNGDLSGTAFLDEDDLATDSATKTASQQSIKAYVSRKYPRGFISGLTPSWTSTSQITFAGGSLDINGDIYDLDSATAITFSPGSNEIHYVMVDESADPATALAAGQFSSTTTAPTWDDDKSAWMDAGADKRCIAWFTTDGSSNIEEFYVSGGDYKYKDHPVDLSTGSPATTATALPLTAPNFGRMSVSVFGSVTKGGATSFLRARNGDSSETLNFVDSGLALTDVSGGIGIGEREYTTDTSQQIDYEATSGATVKIKTTRIAIPTGLAR